MIVPYQHRGPGTPYNAFGELRPRVGRSQAEIRDDLADRAAIADRQRAEKLAALPEVHTLGVTATAHADDAIAVQSAQELHGAGPAAAEQQAATQLPDVIAGIGVHAQVEVA